VIGVKAPEHQQMTQRCNNVVFKALQSGTQPKRHILVYPDFLLAYTVHQSRHKAHQPSISPDTRHTEVRGFRICDGSSGCQGRTCCCRQPWWWTTETCSTPLQQGDVISVSFQWPWFVGFSTLVKNFVIKRSLPP